MAKLIKYDVTAVEDGGGGTGVKVKPGVKVARIAKCTQRTEKRDGSPANDLEVALDVGEEYDWVFTYIGLSESSDWKLKEFTKALGLKDRGQFDPDKLVGKVLRVKINSGAYEGEYSPNAGKLFPAQPGDAVGSASETSTAAAPDEDPEPEGDPDAMVWREGQPDPDNPEDTVASYDDWEETDLLAEVEDRGLTMPGGRGSKKNKAISALRADDSEAVDPESEESSETEETPQDDYEDWDLDALKAEWDEREMGDLPAVRGRNRDERTKATIITALREDDNENPFDA